MHVNNIIDNNVINIWKLYKCKFILMEILDLNYITHIIKLLESCK